MLRSAILQFTVITVRQTNMKEPFFWNLNVIVWKCKAIYVSNTLYHISVNKMSIASLTTCLLQRCSLVAIVCSFLVCIYNMNIVKRAKFNVILHQKIQGNVQYWISEIHSTFQDQTQGCINHSLPTEQIKEIGKY